MKQTSNRVKISVLEPGAWGTALGILLSNKNDVRFWYEDKKLALRIDKFRKNEKLPETEIPKKIFISFDLEKTIENVDLIIIASPSFNFRQTISHLKKCQGLRPSIWTPANRPALLGIAKGIEKETLKLPSQIVEEILDKISYAHLSGPGFAKEVVMGKPAKEVIASESRGLLKKLKKTFQVKSLKIQTTTDLIGVQLAGAMKNSLAIGISLVEAAIESPKIKKIGPKLIKAGMKEMLKLGKAMGGREKTFLGPAGLGDLILTSTGSLSRNFQFGKSLYFNAERIRKDIKERKITVEGFDSTWALSKLAKKYKLDLPMINEIYRVIYKKVPPKKTVKNLIELVKT